MLAQQGSIPEAKDDIPNQVINYRIGRLASFQDLGSPDLIALTKHVPNSKEEVGTYMYYTGLDNSSTSSVAAHLNQIANIIGSKPQAWFGKSKAFKVSRAVYASYNAFAKADVIVTVNFPGTVSSHVVDSFGEKSDGDETFWKELFVSGVVRALLSNEEVDEQVNSIVESRNLNPLWNKSQAIQFLDYFEELFERGIELGSDPQVQNPTIIDNYLIDAFLKVVELTQLYDYALTKLDNLKSKNEAVTTLIVKVLLLQNEEIKAIRTLHDGLEKNSRDASLLIIQSEFLAKKGNLGLALNSAIRALNSSPSEFKPWANLSNIYLELNDVEHALLALNSCPMAAFKEKYHLKRITSGGADRLHLPLPSDVYLEDVYSLDSSQVANEHSKIDPSLIGLQSANLKSTFAKAYEILTKIVHKTGWEALLKYRAKIFVMEEEYKSKSSSTANILSTNVSNGRVNGDASTLDNQFKQKRLCERWLDNLFMLLYEDLKTYTMWQAELIHFQAQKMNYEKLPGEWELLGMCAFRLQHFKEASFAFKKALEGRFAPSSTRNLLKYYKLEVEKLIDRSLKTGVDSNTTNGDNNEDVPSSSAQIERRVGILDSCILECIVKLTVWNHRWYCEFAPFLVSSLEGIVEREGLVKIQSQIKANYSDDSGISDLMEESFQFLRIFETKGSDS